MAAGLIGLAPSACTFETGGIFPVGTPFVLSGTAAIVDDDGACLVWMGDNGLTYHLFQGVNLDNESFDRVTTPGTTSRLRLARRGDLDVACRTGEIVEVQDVLEIID